MSNYKGVGNNNETSERHFNIPSPYMQPYGFGSYGVNHDGLASSYGVNHGGLIAPHQFSNPPMIPHTSTVLNQSSQPNFFSPPPSFPPPHPSFPPPPLPPPFAFSTTSSVHPLPPSRMIDQKVDENNDMDKIWIRNWLQCIGKENQSTSKQDASDSVKIFEMKEKVINVRKLINDLEVQSKSLMVMMKTLNEEEWQSRVEEVEDAKRDLATLLKELSTFASSGSMADVKRKLDKRNKKRKREKKKREERKLANEQRRIAREQENSRIDLWLKGMEEAVERVRREEELKREADSVLSGVTKRKNEAKRQLALLEGLCKLHKARVVAWNSMGLQVSNSQVDTFSNVVDRLTDMWNSRLESYNLEEHGLKVMLTEAVAEDRTSCANRQKLILRQWENALFGSGTNAQNIHVPQDFESFVSVRKDWDNFVVAEDSVMSSSIPVGWIIPSKPSNDGWEKLLKDHKQ